MNFSKLHCRTYATFTKSLFAKSLRLQSKVNTNSKLVMASEKHLNDLKSTLVRGLVSSRLMNPTEANAHGNVHGGNILKLIEEGGHIISTRYCNRIAKEIDPDNFEPVVSAIARVERMDFMKPAYIGELLETHAEITYTSDRSIEVRVSVWAENLMTGERRHCNEAQLWYVPLTREFKTAKVPPLVYESSEKEEAGRQRYLKQKASRSSYTPSLLSPSPSCDSMNNTVERQSVSYSQTVTAHLIGPNDCVKAGFVKGGVIMKLMDECAGVVSAKHCHNAAVTASVEAINFTKMVKAGTFIEISGRPVFTSNRSIEIEVLVDASDIRSFAQGFQPERIVTAFFTFVQPGKGSGALEMPPLKVNTPGEKQRFLEGQERYEEKKRLREMAKNKQL